MTYDTEFVLDTIFFGIGIRFYSTCYLIIGDKLLVKEEKRENITLYKRKRIIATSSKIVEGYVIVMGYGNSITPSKYIKIISVI